MQHNQSTVSIILGTYNRLTLLKKCLKGLLETIRPGYRIFIVDAGSTDGTLKYLENFKSKITIISDGKKLGQVRSMNNILRTLNSQYVCWLSDDNVLQHGSLNAAVAMLDRDVDIGMVGLKVKDVTGPYKQCEYIGGISPAGILNVNQGMVRLDLMKQVGYFDEQYPDYGMDVDLTTKILCTGKTVVYTKNVAIHHFRDYGKYPGAFVKSDRKNRLLTSHQIYIRKYPQLCAKYNREKLFLFRITVLLRRVAWYLVLILLSPFFILAGRTRFYGIISRLQQFKQWIYTRKFLRVRDWNNIFRGQYISLFDLWYNRHNDYYLVQKMRIVNRTEEL